jgi:copper(I)-binding protein
MKASLLLAAPLLAALLALAGCGAPRSHGAAEASKCEASSGGALRIENAWVRAQGDASAMSAAYFTLCNAGTAPVTVEGLTTPAAGLVELHETSRDANGVLSMAPMGPFTLAPGEQMAFEPGGKHAMLMSLAAPIAEGGSATLTLQLAGGETVSAEAKAVSAVEAAGHSH